jgi:bifunctional oligoribonuclease and PAP phosphatase NrnA
MTVETLNKQIHTSIARSENILLISHKNPDADALGSLSCFMEHLTVANKKFLALCVKKPRAHYHFLPHVENIYEDVNDIPLDNVDLVIFFDCGNAQYCGIDDIITRVPKNATIINIDHHETNTLSINKNMALSLLAGIVGDTDSFCNHNTTPQTLDVSSKLVSKGVLLSNLIEDIYKNKTLKGLKQWGKALDRLRINKTYKIGFTVLGEHDFDGITQDSEHLEGLPNYLNNLVDVRLAMVLRENEHGVIKGSLRTSSDLIDTSKLATLLGGGGHKKASGFTIQGRLVETEGGWKVV